MDKDKHIYSICKNLGITLKVAEEYDNQHKNEIENIGTIFSLKGANKEKVLALLYLFSSDENDEVVQQYRSETGLNKVSYDSIKQYNTMLVSALIFNSDFYAMAANYYGAINAGFPIGEIEEDKEDITHPLKVCESSYDEKTQTVTIVFIYGEGRRMYFPLFGSGIRGGAKQQNVAATATDDPKKMISDYTAKIEANPTDYDAYIMRGLAYIEDRKLKKALNDFKEVVEKVDSQGMEGVYYAKGYCHYQLSENSEAIEALKKIMAINPEFANVKEILESGNLNN